jgi:hypothetical protein
MEIIIFVAVVVVAALLWNGYVKAKKTESDQAIDNWQPPKAEDKSWPYGEKLPEGKIHVKVADVAPGKSADDRVETPAPALAVDGHGDVHEIEATPAPVVAETAPAAPTAPVATPPAGGTARAEDILAMIRNRQKTS